MSPPKSKFRKRLEIAVNLALIAVCLIFAGILAKRYFSPASVSDFEKVAIGRTLSMSGAPWSKEGKTVLLFLHSGCQFCTKSADFYADIIKETAADPRLKILAVFSEKDSRFNEYAKEIGLQNIEIRQGNFANFGIDNTPTLVIADENGTVQNFWKGVLSPKKQGEVRRNLGLPVTDWFVEESTVNEFRKKNEAVIVVDVRERELYGIKHFAGAKNIPADELQVRAVNEFSSADTIVVYGNYDTEGEEAQEILAREGFRKVYILRYKFS